MSDGPDPKEPELTPDEVADIFWRLTHMRGDEMSPGYLITCIYPVRSAKAVKLVCAALTSMMDWRPDHPRVASLLSWVDIINRRLKTAVLSDDGAYASFQFTGAELLELRDAAFLVEDYAYIKKRDAETGGRKPYRGKK